MSLIDPGALSGHSDRAMACNQAFLVLAHAEPGMLAKLVASLHHPRAHVIVHVDAKVELAPFARALAGLDNVSLLLERKSILWGGYAMVEAMLALMAAALELPRVARISFLSGADMRVVPLDRVFAFFDEQPDRQFLAWSRIEPGTVAARRHEIPHIAGLVPFMNARDGRTRIERKLDASLTGRLKNVMRECGGASMSEHRPLPAICKGSQWLSLVRPCAEHVLRVLANRTECAAFFRYTDVPDELALPSVVLNSRFASSVVNRRLHYLRWIDNASKTGKFVAELTAADVPAIRSSGALFARKFNARDYDAIRAMISSECVPGGASGAPD